MDSRFIRAALAALALGVVACRAELNWLTDYDTALSQAKAENKVVLVDFTGSDWCGWCIKLKSEVFDTPEFAAFASANLVLLEVDFPKRKPQSAQQRSANKRVAVIYGVEGYPTVFILDAGGHPLAQLGYEAGGPKAYIEGIKKARGVTWKTADGAAPIVSAPARVKPATPDQPLWGGTVFPPKRYDELKLTGLSGPSTRRFAIVNNQTFTSGETARVKLKSGDVKVLCKEIRAKSVVVQVEGASESKEIFFDGN